MGNPLLLESARWQNSHRRIKALLAQSFTLITQACETYLVLQDKPEPLRTSLALLIHAPVASMADVRKRVKQLRHAIAAGERRTVPPTLIG